LRRDPGTPKLTPDRREGKRPSRHYTRPTPTWIPHDTADTGCIVMRQPRIRHNDYTALDVIPAFGHQDKLDFVLAGLAAQSYPDHLMEVIVDHMPGRTRR
jgi:hypothetical protein